MAVLSELPAELVSETLSYIPPQDLRHYRLVSRTFDAHIQGNPRLYSILHNVPVDYLTRLLNLSRELEISVTMECKDENDYDVLCFVLASYMSRIRSLTLAFDRTKWGPAALNNVVPITDLLSTSAPVLRRLRVDTGLFYINFPDQLLDGHAPRLERLHLVGLELNGVQPALARVQYFTGQAAWMDTDDKMHAFTHIQNRAQYFPALLTIGLDEFSTAASIFGANNRCPSSLNAMELVYEPEYTDQSETGQTALTALYDAGCTRLKRLAVYNPPQELVPLFLQSCEKIDAVLLEKDDSVTFTTVEPSSRTFQFYNAHAKDFEQILDTGILGHIELLVIGRQIEYEHEYHFFEELTTAPDIKIKQLALAVEDNGAVLPTWPSRHRMPFTELQELHLTGPRGTAISHWQLYDLLRRVVDLSPNRWRPTLVLHGINILESTIKMLTTSVFHAVMVLPLPLLMSERRFSVQ
ncbi:hypothetical protein EXIGLDRAFT_704865 [Exidia glandulosa HHB12029]|uniref:F-box domain-containing protein n=1 Tax=Exidia glandulosa HHB12029 TaxID=1314781 RepID=A0A165BIB5_EXIGL|nr:hypothetical protein EXIGLDRAFT_704865 [Exidia glandulosa HHB12029]